ncbi:LutC/YkgG family protein [Nocardioides lianchengensis]|uniref:L-lactate dehydrogenase complex protein LldG n=1 Tax=Nocardioides lianchengensis TaxID=1045774 RepID=A0A1G6QBY8_9ACTN|nr:LUD domain-containing protein [Nocardioides lianchengensis]NYG12168.1 L-lactate dehydrogenase complex protein LldG [Nocardioides lianchengensis]SDC89803.1 L-lactate dehydrogenase complex protein LldG [Nocardioides lianchengensis]
MTTARDEILGRVRRALADVEPDREPVASPRLAERPHAEVVDLFAERVEDYRAIVERCTPAQLARKVGAAVPKGATVVVPAGLSVAVKGATVDDGTLTSADLDAIDVVVTDARVGIAETGTIVLDHTAGMGRRAITLVPDRHVCIVRTDQVVADVPDAVELLDPARPLTWISGPSATSDIELDRVEGVHGPRTLHVIIVG